MQYSCSIQYFDETGHVSTESIVCGFIIDVTNCSVVVRRHAIYSEYCKDNSEVTTLTTISANGKKTPS